MNIIFLSNYFNHHQSETSKVWSDLTNGQYCFVETGKMREERKKLGYSIEKPPYVVGCFQEDEKKKIIANIDNADVVVLGLAPDELIKERQRKRRLVFRYSERIYRENYQWYKWPFRMWTFYKRYGKHPNTYMLCSSAYTALDYAKHLTYTKKTYKWGYFPECKKYENPDALITKKDSREILWCGRFLYCKHPDYVLAVAKRLKRDGYNFHINMIGIGGLETILKQLAKDNDLLDVISFLGAMTPTEVRNHMEKSGVYLFTSDRQEGWGAVLNEAMNSGCAVVASHAIGSVPFLIKNKENGLIYESENVDMLYDKVKYLLDFPEEQKRLGKAAYQTIISEWNAEVAAERFINLSEHIMSGEKHPDLYDSGPCSKAEIIKDNWFKG